jgi:hypothetical protein
VGYRRQAGHRAADALLRGRIGCAPRGWIRRSLHAASVAISTRRVMPAPPLLPPAHHPQAVDHERPAACHGTTESRPEMYGASDYQPAPSRCQVSSCPGPGMKRRRAKRSCAAKAPIRSWFQASSIAGCGWGMPRSRTSPCCLTIRLPLSGVVGQFGFIAIEFLSTEDEMVRY